MLKEILQLIPENHLELYLAVQKQAGWFSLLQNIIQTMKISKDFKKIKEDIVNKIGCFYSANRCFILEIDKNKIIGCCEYLASKNEKSISNLPLNDLDVEELQQQYFLQEYNIKSIISIPIIHFEEQLGLFTMHFAQKLTNFDDNDIEFIRNLTDYLGIILYQSNLTLKQEELFARAQQSAVLKSEFIANISHEIRTPLTAIMGFSDMLLSENHQNFSEKQYRFITNITTSGKHLLGLINNLLDISKIEAESMDLSYEKFDSAELINETVSSINSLVYQKNIAVKLDIKNVIINADKGKLRQVMYNLLSNAIKFTHENGQIKVKSDFNNGNLVISVEDTGIGIAKKDQDKIFEQFRQIDSSYSRHQEGTGLGLALTKKLVELHEGSIHFESEPDVGSRFWFILPNAELLSVKSP